MATQPEDLRGRLRQSVSDLVGEIQRYADRKRDPSRAPVGNPPATPEQIESLEDFVGRRLPDSYRFFLQMHDGFARLAYPGNMLRIADMKPPSAIYEQIIAWKRMTTQYGGGEVLGGVVIADANEPNHWVYLDPDLPSAENEWTVVDHTPSDSGHYDDLVAFFASRREAMRGFHQHLDQG